MRCSPELQAAFSDALEMPCSWNCFRPFQELLPLFGKEHHKESLNGQKKDFRVRTFQIRPSQKICADHFQAVATGSVRP